MINSHELCALYKVDFQDVFICYRLLIERGTTQLQGIQWLRVDPLRHIIRNKMPTWVLCMALPWVPGQWPCRLGACVDHHQKAACIHLTSILMVAKYTTKVPADTQVQKFLLNIVPVLLSHLISGRELAIIFSPDRVDP